MDEIEAWVRGFYGVDEEAVGDFERRFVNEGVWKEWMADGVEDWASDEDSHVDLWENQIYRTLTFLSPDEDYTEFVAAIIRAIDSLVHTTPRHGIYCASGRRRIRSLC